MSIAELRKLPPAEKLKIIETLWSDLAADENTMPSPAWHKSVLDARRERVASGKGKFVEWEKAKRELRKRLKQ